MVAPVAAVFVLNLLGAGAYLPWLGKASRLGMFLGMMTAMLYRREHDTGHAGHLRKASSAEKRPVGRR